MTLITILKAVFCLSVFTLTTSRKNSPHELQVMNRLALATSLLILAFLSQGSIVFGDSTIAPPPIEASPAIENQETTPTEAIAPPPIVEATESTATPPQDDAKTEPSTAPANPTAKPTAATQPASSDMPPEVRLEVLTDVLDTAVAQTTTLTPGKKRQIESMALNAYRKSEGASLWGDAYPAAQVHQQLIDLLKTHRYPEPDLTLSFPTDLDIRSDSPVSADDISITLALAETSLRLKQGPTNDPEWPHWVYSDYPYATTDADHYDHITARFAKTAEATDVPIEVAEDFIPKNWIYQRLFSEIQRLENAPPAPRLKVVGLVKVGNEFDQARELAHYLMSEGHLPSEELVKIGNEYSQSLSDAVKSFQKSRNLQADGILGPNTAHQLVHRDADDKVRLMINLHRARRLPDLMGERYLLANLPSGEVHGMDGDDETLRMRVVFGKDMAGRRTPLFRDHMEQVVFSPYWNVPYNIATKEGPYRNLSYLARNNYKIISSRTGREMPLTWSSLQQVPKYGSYIRQDGGKGNALGLVKFLFPNSHAVYMHDTPHKHLFSSDYRSHSHGCVRLQKPAEMANWILGSYDRWNEDTINSAIHGGKRVGVYLEDYIPVYMTYFTAFPDPTKEVGVGHYRDYYRYDQPGAEVDKPAPRSAPVKYTQTTPQSSSYSKPAKKTSSSSSYKKKTSSSSSSTKKTPPAWLSRLRSRINQ